MLMDCLEGNIGYDMGREVPPEYKQKVLDQLSEIHVSYHE